ncbi:MAG: hypothetical protein GOMPHAMPRED_000074 [Gomphillus americanus]|uniref:Elongin-A n=1 Tax=Gomphillus americanus TaxID=1940652 RepID=A0A8H3EA22_9LECA|nr:MAG: hypothetical protein GOMPHAMPRED_000074 [Gomphillus americanus]
MPSTGALSLYELSKRQALRMMKTIDDLGDMPFRIAEPLLKKVQTAAQLHRIEQNCPQFVGATRNIWIVLFKRDLPQWDGTEPKNPKSWYKLYQNLVMAETKATEEDALILKATMDKLAAEKGDRQIHTTNLLHRSKVRGVKTKLGQSIDQSTLRFNGGSRTKMATGKDVLARARREARERSQALNNHSILARPTHTLNQRATSVRQAPTGLVQRHQQEQTSPALNLSPSAKLENNAPRKMTPSEREARLRAINTEVKYTQQTQTLPKLNNSAYPVARTATNTGLIRPPRARESAKRKHDDMDDMDDLFGDTVDSDSEESRHDMSAKKQHIPSVAGLDLSPPKRKLTTDVFLRKPVKKPGR